MITAHHLEVRAGARLADGGRHLPRRRRATRSASSAATAPARRPSPRSSPARPARRRVGARHGQVGYLPQDPRTGDPEVAGPRADPVRARPRRRRTPAARRPRTRWAATTPRSASGRCAATSGPTPSCTPAAGTPPSRRPRRSRSSLGIDDRVLGQPLRHPVRWPAPPGRAGPDPVLRRRDAAARRADQPPRRRLDRLAARVPQGPQGRPGRDQPRHRAARDDRQPGAPPRRQPRPRSTSTTWAGRRTSPSARPTSGAASASG